jgi:hypothetical protein
MKTELTEEQKKIRHALAHVAEDAIGCTSRKEFIEWAGEIYDIVAHAEEEVEGEEEEEAE